MADWATGKSKALKGDIEDLKLDLAEAHEAIAEERIRTQAETAKLEAYKKTVAQQMEGAVRNAVLKKDDEIRNLSNVYRGGTRCWGCLQNYWHEITLHLEVR